MKKASIGFILIFFLFSTALSIGAPAKKKIALLFVIEAAHGSLTHVKGKIYQLTIPTHDVRTVLAFSDRPNRLAFTMKQSEYHKMNYTGKNSFTKNPPNVVLTWGHQLDEAAAYTLVESHIDHHAFVYRLRYIGPSDNEVEAPQTGHLALFIDTVNISLEHDYNDDLLKPLDVDNKSQ